MSGYAGDYLQTHTGELPKGTHFLYKPYDARRLAAFVREILDRPRRDQVA